MAGTAAAKNLTQVLPRPIGAELEGYAWLPRMLDKARATLAGTAGDYQFGCPVDHTCMALLGVTPGLILELANRYRDDADFLTALRSHGIPPARKAWFDAQAVEDHLQDTGIYLRVRRAGSLPLQMEGRVFSGDDHGAEVSVSVIELDPGTAQPPHSHPTEEILVITQGSALIRLSPSQARTVHDGDVVRIPARVIHSIESSGGEPLKAVAAYGTTSVTTARSSP